MPLYNCRHSGDEYRITKFDSDMNPQGSYLLSLEECECPAGVRPTCRHRQMLPRFIAREHIGDEWFFDFDRGGWVQMGPEFRQEPETMDELEAAELRDGVEKDEYLAGIMEHDLPEGVTMIVLDHPNKVIDVHNAIANAVGEPKLGGFPDWCLVEHCITMEECILHGCVKRHGTPPRPPAPTHIKRRF